MIAACDTFRAGAVEQLRTHVRHLNALHPPSKENGPPSVMLYEKGYGKDAAAIAMDAINFGKVFAITVICAIIQFAVTEKNWTLVDVNQSVSIHGTVVKHPVFKGRCFWNVMETL